MFGIEFPSIIVDPARLSIFWRISSGHFLVRINQWHDLELQRHFLNSILEATAAVPVVVVVLVRLVSEATGTGISVPDAMIAFLLLLVKTIGREIHAKRPVELKHMNDRRECVSGGKIDICSLAAFVAKLRETDKSFPRVEDVSTVVVCDRSSARARTGVVVVVPPRANERRQWSKCLSCRRKHTRVGRSCAQLGPDVFA